MTSTLQAEREQAGLTQARLAEMAGIAQSNLSAIESGTRGASPQMVARLRRYMRRPSTALDANRQAVLDAVARCGAQRPRVFGSVAKGTDKPGSDLDLIVYVPVENAWRFASLQPLLVEILGIDVDVVSENGLTDKNRQILDEAVPL